MVPGDRRLDVGQQLLVAEHHLAVILKPEVNFDHLVEAEQRNVNVKFCTLNFIGNSTKLKWTSKTTNVAQVIANLLLRRP